MKLLVLEGDIDAESLGRKFLGGRREKEQSPGVPGEISVDPKKLKINYNEDSLEPKKRSVDKRKNCALEMFAGYLQSEEEIKSYKFGVTQTEAEGIPSNCPVLRAKTDLAEYLLIFEEYEFKGGIITDGAQVVGKHITKKRLGNPLLILFVEEFAKGLGKTVAEQAFKSFFETKQDAVLKTEMANLKNDIRGMLQEMRLEDLTDRLVATRKWLQNDYSTAQIEYLSQRDDQRNTDKIEKLRDDLKKRGDEMADIAAIVDSHISEESLKNCDYLTRARVLLYAAAAALRATLLKEEIFWDREYCRMTGQKYVYNRETVFKDFVKEVGAQLGSDLKTLRDGRYGKIYGLKKESGYVYSDMGCDQVYWFEWGDRFSSLGFDIDPFIGGEIKAQKYYFIPKGKDANEDKRRGEGQRELDDHINEVKRLFSVKIEKPLEETIKKFAETKLLNR